VLLLGVGLLVLVVTVRSRRQAVAPSTETLSVEDRARLDALLSPGSQDS
jgi:cytochrome c-type biogenesis protein CcmH/NrfF